MYRYADVSLEMSKIDWCGIKKWLAVISIFRVGIRNSLCSSTSTTICSTESADLAERSHHASDPLATPGACWRRSSSAQQYICCSKYFQGKVYLPTSYYAQYLFAFLCRPDNM